MAIRCATGRIAKATLKAERCLEALPALEVLLCADIDNSEFGWRPSSLSERGSTLGTSDAYKTVRGHLLEKTP
jgi:hypothetical protein